LLSSESFEPHRESSSGVPGLLLPPPPLPLPECIHLCRRLGSTNSKIPPSPTGCQAAAATGVHSPLPSAGEYQFENTSVAYRLPGCGLLRLADRPGLGGGLGFNEGLLPPTTKLGRPRGHRPSLSESAPSGLRRLPGPGWESQSGASVRLGPVVRR
jgi:hypothetical protein